ncbi:MAG: MFS transporter, partial [Faecalimonas sp.]|nr:MFS transporter [Faecalimonas sp.]
MNQNSTSLEKKWIGYDIGNSAFTLLITTLLPIFFHEIAAKAGVSEDNYLAYWAYTSSAVTILMLFLGPILGTLSDLKGLKLKIFSGCVLVGALSCALLGFVSHWLWFLLVFVFAKCAYQMSLVVYDSMLGDVTTAERMDEVSSKGYAWGYIGSCVPFIVTVFVYVMYEMLGWISMFTSSVLCCLIIAIWWVVWAILLYKSYEQKHFVSGAGHPIRTGFQNLANVFGELKQNKKVLLFLIAFFFFIDGVYTIIDMATSYGTSLGLDTVGLLAALLVTQVVAFPSALVFGKLSRKTRPETLISVCIVAYFFATIYAAFMT